MPLLSGEIGSLEAKMGSDWWLIIELLKWSL